MPRHDWGALRRDEVTALFQEGAVAALAVGALEQHGDHLPTDTDNHIVSHVLSEAADRCRSTIVALPPLPYGFSPYHIRFGATISLTAATYLTVLRDICASVRISGAGTLVILNGHGGNVSPLKMTSHELSTESFHVVAFSYWDVVADAAKVLFAEDGELGHAGQAETSLLLATRPDSVQQLPAPFEPVRAGVKPPTASLLGDTGVIGDPNAGSAALGEQFLAAVIARVAETLDEVLSAPTDASAVGAPSTRDGRPR